MTGLSAPTGRQPQDREQAGHATVAFTLDTYTEDVPELHHDAAETVSNLFLDDTPADQAVIADLTDGTNESDRS